VNQAFISSNSCFIHVPKAGGISIAISLYGYSCGHLTAALYRDSNRQFWHSCFSFAVVREPQSRFLSAYHFLRAGGITRHDRRFRDEIIGTFTTIDSFVDAYLANRLASKYIHFKTQKSFLVSRIRKKPLVSTVYRFESINNIYPEIVSRIRAHSGNFSPFSKELLSLNITPSMGVSEKEDLSDRSIRIIRDFYEDDYLMFGY